MKKNIILISIIFLISFILPTYSYADSNIDWLTLDMINNIYIDKNQDDYDQSEKITNISLPFSLKIELKDNVKENISDFAVIVLEECSFYSKNNNNVYAYYDKTSNSFTFNNLSYSGEDKLLSFIFMDSSLYKKFTLGIPNALPINQDSNTDSSINDENSNNFSSKSSGSTNSKTSTTSSKSPDLPASLKPHLIINSYKYDENISENKTFSVSVEFFNTSTTHSIENIVIELKAPESNLNFVNSTNTKYIQFIGPNKTAEITFDCVLSEISQPIQSIEIKSSFQYYDIAGKDPINNTSSSVINISTPLISSLRLEKIILPESIYIGSICKVNYRLVNTGQAPINSIDISITDKNNQELNRTYIGRLEPNKSISEPEIDLVFKSTGLFPITFNVYYYDQALDKTSKIHKTFNINVENQPPESLSESNKFESLPEIKIPEIISYKEKNDTSSLYTIVTILIIFATLYIIYKLLFSSQNSNKKSKKNKISLNLFKK